MVLFWTTLKHRLRGGLLLAATCLVVGLLATTALAQDLFRWSSGRGGDVQPIKLTADTISTWREANRLVFLLRGKVWIEQGLTNVRAAEAVVWVDQEGQQKTGTYRLEIYAERDVLLEEGAQGKKVNRALVDLSTRSDLKFTPQKTGRIRSEDLSTEAIVQRGQSARGVISNSQPAMQSGSTGDRPLTGPGSPALMPAVPSQALPPAPPATEKNPIQLTAAQPLPGGPGPVPVMPGPGPGVPPPPPPPPGNEVAPPPRVLPGGPPEQAPTPRVIPGVPGGLSSGGPRPFTIRPRSIFQPLQMRDFPNPVTGETAVVLSNGVILTIYNADGHGGILDIEADRAVAWKKGLPHQILNQMRSGEQHQDHSLEFYLSGHVEIRTKTAKETRLLRADEVYYDAGRHVAVAIHGQLEIVDHRLVHPLHLHAEEILQLDENLWEAVHAEVNASELPWDPALSVSVRDATLESKKVVRRTIFGFPYINRATGQPVVDVQRYFRGRSVVLNVAGLPVLWLPYLQGDAEDPLGPLENVGLNYNRIFGFQLYTTWNVYDLIGINAIPDTRWNLNIDYLSQRGPALGTDYHFRGTEIWDMPCRYTGLIKAYGIYDDGRDILGGGRGTTVRLPDGTLGPVTHPDLRGRFLGRINVQDLPEGFVVQSQISALSDQNFLEQYYQKEFFNDLNQETFLYVKQQQDFWAWSVLAEPRLRNWVTETEWLPKADGYLLGVSFFDLITYNAMASAGFGRLRVTDRAPFAYRPTDVETSAGRFDLWQEISLPFTAGPFRIVPYGIVDLTYYTNTLTGDDRGRIIGAGGVRGSMPLSRLYPEVQSDLFNLDGIFHKIVFSANFYTAHSDTSFRRLPQFDRLNDDVSDLTLNSMFPEQKFVNPSVATLLTTSPLFDPQMYALRRLVENRIDTRDDMEVLQLGLRQRWQTKRGFPDAQHVIDWMTLDLSASIFPRSDRDNFGNAVAFLEYDWVWNIGDRTSLVSSGWIDPIDNGPRVFNFGANLNRPDGTNFYLGYRQIDPLQSRAVIGSLTYAFSKKYAMVASAAYDFGIHNQYTSLVLSRTGTDFKVSFGVTYNSILNNFGVIFEIVPNLVAGRSAPPGSAGLFGSSLAGGR